MAEWVVLLIVAQTTLLAFCFRATYVYGYKQGARKVLSIWKNTLKESEENKNEHIGS